LDYTNGTGEEKNTNFLFLYSFWEVEELTRNVGFFLYILKFRKSFSFRNSLQGFTIQRFDSVKRDLSEKSDLDADKI
jgi:hypothetical protein